MLLFFIHCAYPWMKLSMQQSSLALRMCHIIILHNLPFVAILFICGWMVLYMIVTGNACDKRHRFQAYQLVKLFIWQYLQRSLSCDLSPALVKDFDPYCQHFVWGTGSKYFMLGVTLLPLFLYYLTTLSIIDKWLDDT